MILALHKYVEEEEARLEKLKRYIKDFESDIDLKFIENEEEFVSNPLNSFRLIKKLTSDFKDVYDLIDEDSPSKDFIQNITFSRSTLKWPSEEDLNGAASALMRLQEVYKIKTQDLSVGTLNGVEYGPKLTAHDCFEIGRQNYNNGDHYNTEIWMAQVKKIHTLLSINNIISLQALSRYDEEDRKTVKKSDIYEYMAFSAYIQGNLRRALKFTNLLLREDPEHVRAPGNKLYYENAIRESGETLNPGRRKGDDGLDEPDDDVITEGSSKNQQPLSERQDYEQLCRGEQFIPKL